jgi:DNA-binding transcriptional ArsR family regulator
LAAGGRGTVPDALVPIPADRDVGADEQIAALLDYPTDEFRDQALAATSAAWRPAADHPRLWLQTYAALCKITWDHLQPRWQAARPIFDRAVERAGVASVRSGLDAVLDSLSPRIRYRHSDLLLNQEETMPVGGRELVLAPSIAPRDTYFINDSDATLLSVAYPVRSIQDRDDDLPLTDAPSLVLGSTRASMLRFLHGPRTVGAIATHLQISPSAVSRHCDQLASAGLIYRQRHGQRVEIIRTAAGTQLLDALSSK